MNEKEIKDCLIAAKCDDSKIDKLLSLIADSKSIEAIKILEQDIEKLHGNEKYCYLDNSLPTNSQNVRTINEGDIMLFGNDCLVVFYESFSTSYSYTKIGHITDTAGLKQAVGNDDVTVTFYLR